MKFRGYIFTCVENSEQSIHLIPEHRISVAAVNYNFKIKSHYVCMYKYINSI